MIRRFAACLTLLPGLALARPAPPAPSPPASVLLTPHAQCDTAIEAAEIGQKLPARVLAAIAQRESGRPDPDTGRTRPWPWTINYQGQGHFYGSRTEAIEAVRAIQASGGQSIDVGCMQVNLLHHAGAFASLEDAFDPRINAAYAGRFLKTLFTAVNDWGMAIAAYHSRTPGVGEPYRDMVVATWKPTDPDVLARLTFQPLPAVLPPVAGMRVTAGPRLPLGPIPIGQNMVYRSFVQPVSAYQAFRPPALVYGDFSRKPLGGAKAAFKPGGTALDLRVAGSLNRGLVAPKAVIDRSLIKADKPAPRKPRQAG